MKALHATLLVLTLMCQTYPAFCPTCTESMQNSSLITSSAAAVASARTDVRASEYLAALSNCTNASSSALEFSRFILLEPSGPLALTATLIPLDSSPLLIDPPPRA